MKNKFRSLPLRAKMAAISLSVNMVVFMINVIMLVGISGMSDRINSVYEANLKLNELSSSLDTLENSITEYLKTKTSDSLENYYRAEQDYSERVSALSEKITGSDTERLERSIKALSFRFLEEAEQTIEDKRGRNVEKYRMHYEEATKLYGYINSLIYSLNNSSFRENSETYRRTVNVFRTIETVAIVVMVLVIITNIILIMNLTVTLTQPLTALKKRADEVSDGNFDVPPLPVEASDEIGVVTKAFNGMTEGIRDSIEKIRENAAAEQAHKERELMMEAHLKDAQLRYLQAQINPHFLFNTLNAGAQLAMMEEADRTYEYIQTVSEFFRYNVKNDVRDVTIRDELELADQYIYILNVRFSGDIGYEKEVDESLLDSKIPSMILQPLIENCVNHGIRGMEGRGRIRVSVLKEEDRPCILITDNGVGMSGEMIQKLMSGESVSEGGKDSNGIGMDNVIARLRLFTGREDAFEIRSEGRDRGTQFRIRLNREEEYDV